MLALELAASIRFLYRHFLSGITRKSLSAFYYACSYAKVDYSRFMNVTASMAWKIIPKLLESQPVFLCIDDTMVPKFGKKFEKVSKLFDHAVHNGSNYLNGHCFVSLMLCVPVLDNHKVVYQAVPLGYCMWQKEKSKLDVVCNARYDSVIYGTAPKPTGKRGRPAKHGRRLSVQDDFTLSDEKVGDYYTGTLRVLTNIFGAREVLAYVTSTEKDGGSRRLFFSTIFPGQMHVFCAWQEKAPLNQVGSSQIQYIPLLFYSFRWNIEVSYYEQKTFWSLCSYMVRSCKGMEMLVNLVNIAYCAIKLLPYQDETFSEYRTVSVQEFCFAPSSQIRKQVFYTTFVNIAENSIKSNVFIDALKQLVGQQGVHL